MSALTRLELVHGPGVLPWHNERERLKVGTWVEIAHDDEITLAEIVEVMPRWWRYLVRFENGATLYVHRSLITEII